MEIGDHLLDNLTCTTSGKLTEEMIKRSSSILFSTMAMKPIFIKLSAK